MNKQPSSRYVWFPNKGVGDINFKSTKSDLRDALCGRYEYILFKDALDWKTYKHSDPNFVLNFDGEKLESIECKKKSIIKILT